MDSKKCVLLAAVGVALLSSCVSRFNSIQREANGDYVLVGTEGSNGIVWICDYDPQTKTLTVKEEKGD